MAEAANAVDEYIALQRQARWRNVSEQRLELARKSYAQQLARSASQPVADRRKRAELKANIYSHLLPLLELHAKEQATVRQFYRKLVLILGAGLLAVSGITAILLLSS